MSAKAIGICTPEVTHPSNQTKPSNLDPTPSNNAPQSHNRPFPHQSIIYASTINPPSTVRHTTQQPSFKCTSPAKEIPAITHLVFAGPSFSFLVCCSPFFLSSTAFLIAFSFSRQVEQGTGRWCFAQWTMVRVSWALSAQDSSANISQVLLWSVSLEHVSISRHQTTHSSFQHLDTSMGKRGGGTSPRRSEPLHPRTEQPIAKGSPQIQTNGQQQAMTQEGPGSIPKSKRMMSILRPPYRRHQHNPTTTTQVRQRPNPHTRHLTPHTHNISCITPQRSRERPWQGNV